MRAATRNCKTAALSPSPKENGAKTAIALAGRAVLKASLLTRSAIVDGAPHTKS
jgi:hypothetical protein